MVETLPLFNTALTVWQLPQQEPQARSAKPEKLCDRTHQGRQYGANRRLGRQALQRLRQPPAAVGRNLDLGVGRSLLRARRALALLLLSQLGQEAQLLGFEICEQLRADAGLLGHAQQRRVEVVAGSLLRFQLCSSGQQQAGEGAAQGERGSRGMAAGCAVMRPCDSRV